MVRMAAWGWLIIGWEIIEPKTPVLWGYLPVASADLLGLQPELVVKALLNKIPFFAKLSSARVLTVLTP